MNKRLLSALSVSVLLVGCATAAVENVATISDPVAKEERYAALQAAAPKPTEGNGSKYMSPFTTDGVTAEWVTKSMQVQATGAIGEAAGTLAAGELLKNIPFAGMFAGSATKSIARSIALKNIGGEEFLKKTSDQSFDKLEDMAAYMYAFHSSHAEYAKILKATAAIYPEFMEVYLSKHPQP